MDRCVPYEGTRTDSPDDTTSDAAAKQLMAALGDLKDYGTGWANKSGAVTIPAPARADLGLPVLSHWRVMGSPALGIAVLVGPRRSAPETLEFLLTAERDGTASEP